MTNFTFFVQFAQKGQKITFKYCKYLLKMVLYCHGKGRRGLLWKMSFETDLDSLVRSRKRQLDSAEKVLSRTENTPPLWGVGKTNLSRAGYIPRP